MTDIRWKQRFQNFDRAFVLLRSALDGRELGSFSDLEREGLIQRFEYSYERAWKTLRDYLEENGVTISPVTRTEEVILFGSRAKGNFRPESDIDLAIRGLADERAIEALAFELDELPLPFLFDVKSLETIRNPALLEHIRRVGRSIYVANPHPPLGEASPASPLPRGERGNR